jgi:hypothetical protein
VSIRETALLALEALALEPLPYHCAPKKMKKKTPLKSFAIALELIRQHTSAYVSIRRAIALELVAGEASRLPLVTSYTSAYVSMRQHT